MPPYIHQHYPTTKYHATLPPVEVASPVEEDALGDGWADTPAAFCPHHLHSEPEDTHCPKCALALPAPATKKKRR